MFLFHPQAVGAANTNVPGVVQINVANTTGQQPTAVNGVQVQVQVDGASSISINAVPAQNGSSSSSTSNTNLQSIVQQAQPQLQLQPAPQPQPQTFPNGDTDSSEEDEDAVPRRYLRIRDFNPYLFSETPESLPIPPEDEAAGKGKGKGRARWRVPRLVQGPSKTSGKGRVQGGHHQRAAVHGDHQRGQVRGDGCDDGRLSVVAAEGRGKAGKLKRVEVLMM
ncbi:hypothetical protein NLJ89_g9604 [Agrocybe chaxingu]|uniref:Uncharacterized protein n=1 Tax=Agrocybe chaxingu TaxID=84603 RepID=A0A9W8JQG2_9AGAR|nr:hypothetical protein NLJ89_g9604 [Agrocybe chaxingu]